MKIVLLGYIVRGPLGGLAWHHFQYVLGLRALGHDILFLEDSGDYPECYDPTTSEVTEISDYGLRFINNLFERYSLKDNWAYFDAHTNTWFGIDQNSVNAFCSSAEIVINLSGVNLVRDWWINIPKRALIDTDPGFTQIKHLSDPVAKELASQHTHYFTFAENIGKQSCTIPDDGFDWQITRQPVNLEVWKVTPVEASAKWTTVMQWDSYKAREYKGQIFGMKSLSFQDYENLPVYLPDEIFELALGSATAPRKELQQKGWHLIDPLIPTKTPWSYQQYIEQSKGEWGVAKHGYVTSNSGWFSERSLSYMACGKPVITQDTGFSEVFETGLGVLAFSTVEEAVEQVKEVNKDYKLHCRQSRRIVEELFNARKVLTALLGNT